MAVTITVDFNCLRVAPDRFDDLCAEIAVNCQEEIEAPVIGCMQIHTGVALTFESIPWGFESSQAFMDDIIRQVAKMAEPFAATVH